MPLTPEELEPILRLGLVPGVGPTRLAALIGRFGDAAAVMAAPASALKTMAGIGPELAVRIRSAGGAAARAEAARALRRLDRFGAFALTAEDPLYPAPFLDLLDHPYLLFARGDLTTLGRLAVAVVGTRTPSRYGRVAAEELSAELALAGVAIVSGMARGIDTAAHVGALRADGVAIGVLGHGIDRVYPPESRRLFDAVAARGLLLTEYMPGETPKPGNFPRRNRLITALSRAVLVVEMGHRSGAQHTVNFGLEQGREVMAVPGPIGSPSCEGTNQLIKDGARMVTSAADVLEELLGVGTGSAFLRPAAAAAPAPEPALPLLDPQEERLLNALGAEPEHVDALTARAGLPTADVTARLLELELRGLVRAMPGKRYCRK